MNSNSFDHPLPTKPSPLPHSVGLTCQVDPFLLLCQGLWAPSRESFRWKRSATRRSKIYVLGFQLCIRYDNINGIETRFLLAIRRTLYLIQQRRHRPVAPAWLNGGDCLRGELTSGIGVLTEASFPDVRTNYVP